MQFFYLFTLPPNSHPVHTTTPHPRQSRFPEGQFSERLIYTIIWYCDYSFYITEKYIIIATIFC